IGMHAVGQKMARADALAAILLRLPRPDRGAGYFTDNGGEDHVALELHPALLESLARDHERGHTALHVGDAETLHLVADDAAFEIGFRFDAADHAQVFARAGEARVCVAVEAETEPGAVALEDAHRIGAIDLDILAHGLESVCCEPREDEF